MNQKMLAALRTGSKAYKELVTSPEEEKDLLELIESGVLVITRSSRGDVKFRFSDYQKTNL